MRRRSPSDHQRPDRWRGPEAPDWSVGSLTPLTAALYVARKTVSALVSPLSSLIRRIRDGIERINAQQVVFFTRGDNVANLNRVMLYVKRNEHTNRIKMVHVTADKDQAPEGLARDLEYLDRAYPEIDIEFLVIEGEFTPELVARLSEEWHIPTNFMFIGCPGTGMTHSLAELGGVRVIV